MDKNSRSKPERDAPSANRAEAQKSLRSGQPVHDPVDWINRALFEDWLQRYGSWDAFIQKASREKRSPDGAPDDDPTTH